MKKPTVKHLKKGVSRDGFKPKANGQQMPSAAQPEQQRTETESIKHYPIVEVKQDILVTLSDKVLKQIQLLHKTFGKTEWSGPIFYSMQGTPGIAGEVKIVVEDFYLYDVGSPGHTVYEFDERLLQWQMNHPHTFDLHMGHLHTHHSMGTFFSGTDMAALHGAAPQYVQFLSVIVNHAAEYIAKVAFLAKSTRTFRDWNQQEQILQTEAQELVVIDCKVEMDWDQGGYLEQIKGFLKKPVQKTIGFGGGNATLFADEDPWEGFVNPDYPEKGTDTKGIRWFAKDFTAACFAGYQDLEDHLYSGTELPAETVRLLKDKFTDSLWETVIKYPFEARLGFLERCIEELEELEITTKGDTARLMTYMVTEATKMLNRAKQNRKMIQP